MADRFDFEQSIFACWSIIEDLDVAVAQAKDLEELTALLSAIRTLYSAKFEHTFNMFEELVHEDMFCKKSLL